MRIDLQTNLISITSETQMALRLEAVPRAVAAAGFLPDVMHIRARGSYEVGDETRFRIRGWDQALLIRSIGAPASHEVTIDARVDYAAEQVVLVPVN